MQDISFGPNNVVWKNEEQVCLYSLGCNQILQIYLVLLTKYYKAARPKYHISVRINNEI